MAARWIEGTPATADVERSPAGGRDIVCVSVMDWDWPFWTSRQHLMAQFARRNRVLFVDPPLTFASDYLGARRDRRLRRKLLSWLIDGGLSRRGENLLVWSPPPSIPFNRLKNQTLFRAVLSLNQAVFRASLRRTLRRLGFRHPILWVSFNVYYGDAVVGRLGESLSVYHCTDEISGFPGYSPRITDIETRLAARCDLVVASSEVLRDNKARHNPNSHFVPNAADVELFEQAASWEGSCPADLLKLRPPRAGFVGQIEYRFDVDLLSYVAQRMPAWSFALIGPVQEGNAEVDRLRCLPNVHFLGLKERTALPAYLAHLQVALIPYKINRLTRGIYPLKLHEYLAAGKPVVATPLPSLQAMADLVYLAGDGPSFVEAVEQAAREDSRKRQEQRRALARKESWQIRAEEISGLMEDVLGAKETSPGGPVPEPRSTASGIPLSLAVFLRLGRELSRRHKGLAKRLTYRVFGDLNIHRRVRAAHVLAVVKEMPLSEAEVLDAGCGEGACSIALARELSGCRVIGVDIDHASVEACRRSADGFPEERLRFEQADITSLPYARRFAAAVCVDVLEHVDADWKALASIYRALKPGGKLVVHVPLRHQLQRRFLPTHNGHHVRDHVRDEYRKEEIVGKLEQAGFRIDSVRTTFGLAGELAFELNTLAATIPGIRELLAALTYPFALALGYIDVGLGARRRGNSFLIVATKPAR